VRDKDTDKDVTSISLDAFTTDAAKAKGSVENAQAELKNTVERLREMEKLTPVLKPVVDFAESIKLNANGAKATLTGTMQEGPVLPALMMDSFLVNVSREPARRNP
jgi:hypothetical protein